jgi:hypothetical protein
MTRLSTRQPNTLYCKFFQIKHFLIFKSECFEFRDIHKCVGAKLKSLIFEFKKSFI